MAAPPSPAPPESDVQNGDAVPPRTRFDGEIVPGMDGLPAEWRLGSGRVLRRSGQVATPFPDASGGVYRVEARERRLPAVPGSRDAFKLDSQVWCVPPAGAPELAAHGPAFAPQGVALPDGGVLVVFRAGGTKAPLTPELDGGSPARAATAAHLRQREAGGAWVGYAYRHPDGRWQRGDVARAEELLVREGMEQDTFAGRLQLRMETLGPPALGVDAHGVPWCLWANPVRRHVYFARWLGPGYGFTAPLEARGAYYALAPEVALETQAPAGATDMLGAAVAGGKVHQFALPAPALRTSTRHQVLLLDLLEVAEASGVEHRLGTPQKRPENPLLTPEAWAEATGGPLRPLGAPVVWRHVDGHMDGHVDSHVDGDTPKRSIDAGAPVRGRLLMELSPRGPMGGGATGHLESDDGLRWRRRPVTPTLDGAPLEGEWCITWMQDQWEPDPQRRYKGALIRGNWNRNRERWLVTSADTLAWRTEGDMAGLHHLKEHGGPSFRDPATGAYVAVSRTGAACGRALGMLRSADLHTWEGEEAHLDVEDPYGRPARTWRGQLVAGRILDPAGERGAEQIYWGTVWPEHGLYLCLYGRYQWDARYDVALAVSRDGRNFMRIHNGGSLLPCGPAGEWDSGIVFMDFGVTRPVPFPEQDIVRLYYAGSSWRHGADPYRVPSAVGAADLRRNGWAYLQRDRDAELPATVTTIPIQADGPAALVVDADGPVRYEIEGEGGGALAAIPQTGTFRVRFFLEEEGTRLYGFGFETPAGA